MIRILSVRPFSKLMLVVYLSFFLIVINTSESYAVNCAVMCSSDCDTDCVQVEDPDILFDYGVSNGCTEANCKARLDAYKASIEQQYAGYPVYSGHLLGYCENGDVCDTMYDLASYCDQISARYCYKHLFKCNWDPTRSAAGSCPGPAGGFPGGGGGGGNSDACWQEPAEIQACEPTGNDERLYTRYFFGPYYESEYGPQEQWLRTTTYELRHENRNNNMPINFIEDSNYVTFVGNVPTGEVCGQNFSAYMSGYLDVTTEGEQSLRLKFNPLEGTFDNPYNVQAVLWAQEDTNGFYRPACSDSLENNARVFGFTNPDSSPNRESDNHRVAQLDINLRAGRYPVMVAYYAGYDLGETNPPEGNFPQNMLELTWKKPGQSDYNGVPRSFFSPSDFTGGACDQAFQDPTCTNNPPTCSITRSDRIPLDALNPVNRSSTTGFTVNGVDADGDVLSYWWATPTKVDPTVSVTCPDVSNQAAQAVTWTAPAGWLPTAGHPNTQCLFHAFVSDSPTNPAVECTAPVTVQSRPPSCNEFAGDEGLKCRLASTPSAPEVSCSEFFSTYTTGDVIVSKDGITDPDCPAGTNCEFSGATWVSGVSQDPTGFPIGSSCGGFVEPGFSYNADGSTKVWAKFLPNPMCTPSCYLATTLTDTYGASGTCSASQISINPGYTLTVNVKNDSDSSPSSCSEGSAYRPTGTATVTLVGYLADGVNLCGWSGTDTISSDGVAVFPTNDVVNREKIPMSCTNFKVTTNIATADCLSTYLCGDYSTIVTDPSCGVNSTATIVVSKAAGDGWFKSLEGGVFSGEAISDNLCTGGTATTFNRTIVDTGYAFTNGGISVSEEAISDPGDERRYAKELNTTRAARAFTFGSNTDKWFSNYEYTEPTGTTGLPQRTTEGGITVLTFDAGKVYKINTETFNSYFNSAGTGFVRYKMDLNNPDDPNIAVLYVSRNGSADTIEFTKPFTPYVNTAKLIIITDANVKVDKDLGYPCVLDLSGSYLCTERVGDLMSISDSTASQIHVAILTTTSFETESNNLDTVVDKPIYITGPILSRLAPDLGRTILTGNAKYPAELFRHDGGLMYELTKLERANLENGLSGSGFTGIFISDTDWEYID